jgi:hypothetical protein
LQSCSVPKVVEAKITDTEFSGDSASESTASRVTAQNCTTLPDSCDPVTAENAESEELHEGAKSDSLQRKEKSGRRWAYDKLVDTGVTATDHCSDSVSESTASMIIPELVRIPTGPICRTLLESSRPVDDKNGNAEELSDLAERVRTDGIADDVENADEHYHETSEGNNTSKGKTRVPRRVRKLTSSITVPVQPKGKSSAGCRRTYDTLVDTEGTETENCSDSVSESSAVESGQNCKTSLQSCEPISLQPKKNPKSGCRRSYDKRHYCIFCKKPICSKISRHLLSVHKHEQRIVQILELPKGCPERTKLLRLITNEGNFEHNVSTLKDGRGNIVVGRRGSTTNTAASEYTVCSFCKKWQTKHNLWRHSKTCQERISYFGADEVDDELKNRRVLAVRNGQALIAKSVFQGDDDGLNELLTRMKDDAIKQIVMSDELIKYEGSLRMSGLGRLQDRKQDDIYRVSQSVRTLGRVLHLARQDNEGISLHDLLVPAKFDFVVHIGKQMTTDKEKPSLHVGKTLQNLLHGVCDTKYCIALRAGDEKAKEDANDFKRLVDREWNRRVNRPAMLRVEKQRRTTVPLIPITDDLKSFRIFLEQSMNEARERLIRQANPQDWMLLAECTMSRLLMFNGRRRNEVRELKVDEYLRRPSWNSNECGEMNLALSYVDRMLAKR